MRKFSVIIAAASLFLWGFVFASSDSTKNPCEKFDQIAMQLAFAQNGMSPPKHLEEIQLNLGSGDPTKTSTTTTYSWVHKNRILLLEVNNDDITEKMLSGKDDGSPTSRKMEQIYTRLKSATSVWIIKDIEKDLGKGHASTNKTYHHTWHCKGGSLELTTNQNNKITATKITYALSPKMIKLRLGESHPKWDEVISSGKNIYTWRRSFRK